MRNFASTGVGGGGGGGECGLRQGHGVEIRKNSKLEHLPKEMYSECR